MSLECIWPSAVLCIKSDVDLKDIEHWIPGTVFKLRFNSGSDRNDFKSYFDITHSQLECGSPVHISRLLKRELGPGTRVGLSVNAPLALFAASRSSSSALNVIAPWNILSELDDVNLVNLPFIRSNLLQRLQLHGIEYVKDLARLGRLDISRLFGPSGLSLLDVLHGGHSLSQDDQTEISEQMVLPPNSRGKKLILRYLKQSSYRLAGRARLLGKSGGMVQLSLIYDHKKSMKRMIQVDDDHRGRLVFRSLAEKLPRNCMTETVLALKLALVNNGHMYSQTELPLAY